MNIEVTTLGNETLVTSPYHAGFVTGAKNLGGKYLPSTKSWVFDARREAQIRELLVSIYGHDGSPLEACDLKKIRITFLRERNRLCEGITIAGRVIVRATGRDSGAKLGEGVALISGRLRSTGSVRNWNTTIDTGTVLELLDVPVSVIPASDEEITVEIMGEQTAILTELQARRAALQIEMEALDRQITSLISLPKKEKETEK